MIIYSNIENVNQNHSLWQNRYQKTTAYSLT